MFIQEHNCETGEIIQRELDANELSQREADQESTALRKTEAEAKATARQALLDKLGITQEEATLLLGGN